MTPELNGMDKNGTGMYRNAPERAGMTPEYTEMSLIETGINTNMVGSTWKGQNVMF